MAVPKEAKPFRVFVTRHYIAVRFVDVMAKTPASARSKARAFVRRTIRDARAEANDNQWQADAPTPIPAIGSSAAPFETREAAPGVFVAVDHWRGQLPDTARDELIAAVNGLIDHAREMYPHFESERGQADIERATVAVAAFKAAHR